MLYPRNTTMQAQIVADWRSQIVAAGRSNQPVMEPLYIDVVEDSDTPPLPIHLGLRLGVKHLRSYLKSRQAIGINHFALNLRFNNADMTTTLKKLADNVLPDFA